MQPHCNITVVATCCEVATAGCSCSSNLVPKCAQCLTGWFCPELDHSAQPGSLGPTALAPQLPSGCCSSAPLTDVMRARALISARASGFHEELCPPVAARPKDAVEQARGEWPPPSPSLSDALFFLSRMNTSDAMSRKSMGPQPAHQRGGTSS